MGWIYLAWDRETWQVRTFLGYYVASGGNFLPTFRDNQSVQSSGPVKMGPVGCPDTSVKLPLLAT
jgi:hypothetical protein